MNGPCDYSCAKLKSDIDLLHKKMDINFLDLRFPPFKNGLCI